MKVKGTAAIPFTISVSEKNCEKKGKSRGGSLYLTPDQDSRIEVRRNSAKKQAMKLVSDAWNRDEKSSQNIKNMQQERNDMLAKLNEWNSKLKDIDNQKQTLQVEYGIDPDSQEQKDLELLEKYSEIYGMKLSSLILLSENYEEANKSNKGDKFIRNMMIKLIEKMTPDLEE